MKAKINEMLGMPAGKQKLQIEVRQVLDRVLVVILTFISLCPQQRGGSGIITLSINSRCEENCLI